MRILQILIVGVTLLAFAFTIACTESVRAQVPKVTAGEVVDRESLRGYVTWATSEFAAITDINEGSRLIQAFRTEGSDWNVGNMYLILFTLQGQVFLHGEDPNLDGKNVLGVVDDDGTRIVEQLLTAGSVEGKFVEWCWDDPLDVADPRCKDSYALRYRSLVAGVDFVVVGGYYQDLTHVGEPLPDIPLPEVSAADVVDRESLKQFVDGALSWLAELVGQVGFARANEWKQLLREEGGHFKSGPIYLFVFTPEGYVIFHGADPWREGRTVLDNTDFQGRPFVREVIATAQAGGGFVEYFWDDPTVQGDEDTGTPKVSYAVSFRSDLPVYQGIEFIVGAGFYRNFSTAEAETAAADWLARFGRSVASQAMEMIGYRVSFSNEREDHVEVGGQSLNFRRLIDPNTIALVGTAGPAAVLPLSANKLFRGSSFQVSPGGSNGGAGYALWGGGEIMQFDNEVGEGFSDGSVRTAALGADYAFGRVVTGVAMTYSMGSGDFELGRPGQDDVGEVSTNLTSAFPYARFAIGERLLTWSVLGYGAGKLNIGGGGEEDPESDITMRMAGLGLVGSLLQSEDSRGLSLRLRSDALAARMTSEAVEGRSELTSDISRVRIGVEGSKTFATGAGTLVRPELRAGMRYDGGDIDTGFGMEVGGGVYFVAVEPGLTLGVHGRVLVAHEQSGYDEWGLGGSITFNPGGGGRGLSLGLTPTWGSTTSGLARLWSNGAAGMMHDAFGRRQLDAEIGYGVEAPGGRGIVTPYARLALLQQPAPSHLGLNGMTSSLSSTPIHAFSEGAVGYQLGGRLTLGPGMSANVEAGRNAWSLYSGQAHSATVNLSLYW